MKNKTLQEVYKNSSDEVKEILKTKFSNKDLGIGDVKQQIRNEILEIIKKNIKNVMFLDEYGFVYDLPSRLEIFDENRDWLFDIDYNEKNKHFWYSYNRIFKVFESKFNINLMNFNEIMNIVVKEDLKMDGVTPHELYTSNLSRVKEDLKMDGVTPIHA